MKKVFLLIAGLTISTSALALFCPNNFNQINIGDSLDTVKQQCGKPDAEETHQQKPIVPQQLSYYVSPIANSTYKMQVTVVTDANNKATSISVNGVSILQTNVCGGTQIKVGDTVDQVKKACGSPAFTNQSATPDQSSPAIDITILTYNTAPPTQLIFESGKLKERK